MMKLGFVSAILPDLDLEGVMHLASRIGYDCVEVMCWPEGADNRRYAGVSHIDVSGLTSSDVNSIKGLIDKYGVHISALGYYPNPLTSDKKEAQLYIDHIKRVIEAAAHLDIGHANTFIGRDHTRSVEDNWKRFLDVWPEIVEFSANHQVKLGIENCPMYFTDDEWPGGKNLATNPYMWKRMFSALDSAYFGLNYDPSHMVWQHMDYLEPLKQFSDKIFHVHAKDVRIDYDRLNEVGIMFPPNDWHAPKLPGLGEIDWGKFFSILTSLGYDGSVCVEVEDRAYEGSLEKRQLSLIQSHSFLRQFVPTSLD